MNKPNPDSLLVKFTLLIASTLTSMSGSTIAPSLPAMQAYFSGVENADYWVRLALTVPSLFIVIGAPIVGLIIDRLGRKPLLVVSTILYGLAGSSGFLLNSLAGILMSRALLGLAVPGVVTSVTTLIADYYTGQARAKFMGLQEAFMGFGSFIFLLGSGILVDLSNWHVPFLLYLLAFVILPFIVLSLYEPSRTGIRTLTPQGGMQFRAVRLPLRLLMLVYGVALLMQVIFFLIPVQLPFYLQSLTNASATQSGFAIAIICLFSALGSMMYGQVKARMGFVSIAALTFGLVGIGYVIIGLAGGYEQVLIGLAVGGQGLGLLMPNLNLWLTAEVPNVLRGRALSGLTTFFFLGQFLSPVVSQPLSQQIGFGTIYTLAGGVMLLLALIFVGMRRRITALIASPSRQL